MLPFYFLLYLPKRANEGIVLLQRFKQFGIRTIFLQDINQYFSLQYPNLEIEMNPLVPEQLINQYLDGRIIKLRFIRFNFPEDLADFIYNNQNHVEEEGSTEYVVSVKRGGNINLKERFHEVVDGRRNLKDLIEIQKIQNFDYDNVKIEVMIGKNRRTIDLSHLDRIRAYYDITNDIILGDNGHPDFDSINSIAEQLLKDLLNSITRGI